MFKFITKLRKPTIKAQLINKGTQAKVVFTNVASDQVMILLFMTMKQIAKSLGMEPRALMNRVIDLDKSIVKAKKDEEKEARRQSYLKK